MAYVIASSIVANAAWWIGAGFSSLAIFCILFMYLFRLYGERNRQRERAIYQNWERILFESISGMDAAAEKKSFVQGEKKGKRKKISGGNPPRSEKDSIASIEVALKNKDDHHFLFYWNYLHESLRGSSKDSLNDLGAKIELERKGLRLLKSPLLLKKLIAIGTLGNLKTEKAEGALMSLTNEKDPVVSQFAMRALLRIDFHRNSLRYFHLLASRKDWSPIFVAEMLKEHGADKISMPLVELVADNYESGLPERQMARLISYLSLAHQTDYSVLLKKILNESNKTELLIACLRLAQEGSLPRIRKLLKDQRWQVRMQCVLTIGRLGNEKDVPLIISSLNDLDWWVRYRSACALIYMQGVTLETLESLSQTLPNQFSRDVLCHVLAELNLGCLLQPSSTSLSK